MPDQIGIPKFPELCLTNWPFQVVPDSVSSKNWAGRPILQKRINRLLFKWSRVDNSSIHLMWADLGAGKSHTLMHIKNKCNTEVDLSIFPVYSVMPKQLKNFLDVYRAIIAGLDFDEFSKMYTTVSRALRSPNEVIRQVFPEIPDAARALSGLRSDVDRVRNLAQQWLRATPAMAKRDLTELGVTRRLSTTDDAVSMLGGLIKLVEISGRYRRVVIMLDECQRMFATRRTVGQDVNTGLQTWFDASPKNLTLLLSFGTGEENFVRSLLSPEIQSREDPEKISVPLFAKEDAKIFVSDILKSCHTEDAPTPTYPFDDSQVSLITDWLCQDGHVTPRTLMKCFDAVLSELDFRTYAGGSNDISNAEILALIGAAKEEDERIRED